MRDQRDERPVLGRLSLSAVRGPIRDLAAALRINLRPESRGIRSGRVPLYRRLIALLNLQLRVGLAEQTLRVFEQVLLGPLVEFIEMLDKLRMQRSSSVWRVADVSLSKFPGGNAATTASAVGKSVTLDPLLLNVQNFAPRWVVACSARLRQANIA